MESSVPMIMGGRKASAFHIRTAGKKYCGRNQMGTLARCPNFFFSVNGKRPVEFLEYTLWTTTIKWNSTVNYSKLSILTIQFQGVASHRLL